MFEHLCDFATRGGIFSSQVGLVDVMFYVLFLGFIGGLAVLDVRKRDAVRAAELRERRLAARALRRQRELLERV